MKLFDNNGHLSDQGFSLLLNDGGNELQRLEISEHLSFCDACLSKYLDKLESQPLITPHTSMVSQIQENAARCGRSLFYRRFTVVAAGFLAMVLWSAGAFSWPYRLIEANPAEKLARQSRQIFQEGNEIGQRIADKYQELLDAVSDWSRKDSPNILKKE